LKILVAIASIATASAALAQDYPRLKSGHWELTIASRQAANAPPQKSTMCIDDALQKEMMSMGAGMSREMCTKNEFKRDGARFVGNSECKMGDSKIVSRSVMTLTGDTAYRTEITATYEPPFMGMKDSQTVLDGKYLGACPAGMAAGDFIGPGGQKFNVRNVAAGKAAGAPQAAPGSQPATAPQPAQRPKAAQ
jgi:hypothetical protein